MYDWKWPLTPAQRSYCRNDASSPFLHAFVLVHLRLAAGELDLPDLTIAHQDPLAACVSVLKPFMTRPFGCKSEVPNTIKTAFALADKIPLRPGVHPDLLPAGLSDSEDDEMIDVSFATIKKDDHYLLGTDHEDPELRRLAASRAKEFKSSSSSAVSSKPTLNLATASSAATPEVAKSIHSKDPAPGLSKQVSIQAQSISDDSALAVVSDAADVPHSSTPPTGSALGKDNVDKRSVSDFKIPKVPKSAPINVTPPPNRRSRSPAKKRERSKPAPAANARQARYPSQDSGRGSSSDDRSRSSDSRRPPLKYSRQHGSTHSATRKPIPRPRPLYTSTPSRPTPAFASSSAPFEGETSTSRSTETSGTSTQGETPTKKLTAMTNSAKLYGVILPNRFRQRPNMKEGRRCPFCHSSGHLTLEKCTKTKTFGPDRTKWPMTCTYPLCNQRQTHRTFLCPTLHARCYECKLRGHLPDSCHLTREEKRKHYENPEFGPKGLFTSRGFKKSGEDAPKGSRRPDTAAEYNEQWSFAPPCQPWHLPKVVLQGQEYGVDWGPTKVAAYEDLPDTLPDLRLDCKLSWLNREDRL